MKDFFAYIIRQQICEQRNKRNKQSRQQLAGFRIGKSFIYQIPTTRIIVIEHTIAMNTILQLLFIDFEQAFDSLRDNKLWMILKHYRIPDKMIQLIKMMYDEATFQVT